MGRLICQPDAAPGGDRARGAGERRSADGQCCEAVVAREGVAEDAAALLLAGVGDAVASLGVVVELAALELAVQLAHLVFVFLQGIIKNRNFDH